jgi:hypothetical protein
MTCFISVFFLKETLLYLRMQNCMCSYCVPTILVECDSVMFEQKILAIPKSDIFGFISLSMRMLLAFKSL